MNKELYELLAKMEEIQKNDWPENLTINEHTLVCTCMACPEQYDVFNSNGSKVGYLRLRHGNFRADCPTVGGTTVYSSKTKGDGVFSEDERIAELTKAIQEIKKHWETVW